MPFSGGPLPGGLDDEAEVWVLGLPENAPLSGGDVGLQDGVVAREKDQAEDRHPELPSLLLLRRLAVCRSCFPASVRLPEKWEQ